MFLTLPKKHGSIVLVFLVFYAKIALFKKQGLPRGGALSKHQMRPESVLSGLSQASSV